MSVRQELVPLIIAAVLGTAVLVVPVMGLPAEADSTDYFLPIVPKAFHNLSFPVSVPLLFLAGFIPGLLPSTSFLAVGAATVISLPAWSILDILDAYIVDGVERHNLLPIEWFFYALWSWPGIAGAWVASLIRRRRA